MSNPDEEKTIFPIGTNENDIEKIEAYREHHPHDFGIEIGEYNAETDEYEHKKRK